MFEKSLQDLVKGIRAHKRDPAAFVSTAIAECKKELKNVDPFVKAQAVRKLTYLQMLGYDVSWASFAIVETIVGGRRRLTAVPKAASTVSDDEASAANAEGGTDR